jgi:hypothetical protein
LDQGLIANGVLGVLLAGLRVEGTQPTVVMAYVPEDVERETAKRRVALVVHIVIGRRRRPKLPGESTG